MDIAPHPHDTTTTRPSRLTIQQVAELWQCEHQKVRRLIKSGELRAIKVGAEYRIPSAAIEEYEQANTVRVPRPRGRQVRHGVLRVVR